MPFYRHSHPVIGHNNEPTQNHVQPQVNQVDPGQFQPVVYSDNLLKQHAALWRRRARENPQAPPQPQTPITVPPGRQSHSHIRALLLAKQQKNVPHQQPSPSCPLPNNQVGMPAMQKPVPAPLATTATPQFLPHVFQPTYEGVIRHMPAKDAPQLTEVLKEPKNPFTLGPVPSLQLPLSLRAPRPVLSAPAHPSIQFNSSAKNVAVPEHPPLNYPFFILNGCTYTSATSAVPNMAARNDSDLYSQKS